MTEPEPHPESLFSTRVELAEWQKGDADALGRIYTRFEPLVSARIRYSKNWPALQERTTIEDAQQEVWARVLRSGPNAFELREEGGFAGWLGHLVDSTLVDLLRRASAQKRGAGKAGDAFDTAADALRRRIPGQASLTHASVHARAAEFEAMAEHVLGEKEAKVWRWVVLEGYTSEEAALGLGGTAASVRGILLRSRRKLQQALAERGLHDL